MKVSQLRCTNCTNVDVKIDWKKHTYYCPMCGTHFVFEKDTDNKKYYIINMISAPRNNGNSVEDQLKSAKYFLEKAEKLRQSQGTL